MPEFLVVSYREPAAKRRATAAMPLSLTCSATKVIPFERICSVIKVLRYFRRKKDARNNPPSFD
jgi:hypothetical protein